MTKDIKKETLKKISDEKIKIKSKSYFQLLNILLYGISVVLILTGIYIFNLMFYLPSRSQRMLPQESTTNYLSLFPWPLLIAGSMIVGLIIFVYRNYEGGYKKHLAITAGIIFFIILFGGALVAGANLNEELERKPHFKRFYQWNEDNFVPRGHQRMNPDRLPSPMQ